MPVTNIDTLVLVSLTTGTLLAGMHDIHQAACLILGKYIHNTHLPALQALLREPILVQCLLEPADHLASTLNPDNIDAIQKHILHVIGQTTCPIWHNAYPSRGLPAC